ncbi:MAG: STAS/SEC14 domain-containing protein [Marivita sp.]|uniref:STAS/SEC14 domain-containing protein n=1 Tax=Marivita sp. TaxID=2003365 RepID=UPI0025BE6580|nr:STAS/SEC14 domain-containing protein [Marivita sp.]MCI5111637.1 STAS/SEC14 domain-containing protein [Marivita sp.]
MLTITKPEPNRVDIDLSGKISSEEMAQGLDDLLEMSQDVNKGTMLYTITSFAFPDLGAIAVEMARLPKLFGLLGRFDRCAVLSDAAWLRTAAEVEGAFIPGFDIKAFDLGEREAAEAWLKTGMA